MRKSDEQKSINKRARDEKRNIEAKARLQPITDLITQLHSDGYFVTTKTTADLLDVAPSFIATVVQILTRIGEVELADHKIVYPRNHCRGAVVNKTYIPAGAQQLSIAGRSTVELTDENIMYYRTFDANTLRHGRFQANQSVQITKAMRLIVKTLLSTDTAMTYETIAIKHKISERTARNYTAALVKGGYIYMYSFKFIHELKPRRYFTASMKKAARHLDDVKPLKRLPVITSNHSEIDVVALASNALNQFTVLNYPRLEA